MAQINLIETIQQNLGFPPLQKIDPNTEEVTHEEKQTPEGRLAQAAIPAVVTGLYVFATSEEGANTIVRGNKSTDWVQALYKGNGQKAIQTVASYARTDEASAQSAMERVAEEAVTLIRQQLKPDASHAQVKDFFTAQRDKILVYLPGSLHIGQLLKDDTFDDRTHKMRGPVSGFMHTVEKALSGGVKEKDEWGLEK